MGFWDFLTGSTPAGVISDTGHKVVAGVFDGVGALIDRFHLSPEEAQQFKLELAKLQLDTYKTQISDVQSARQMQMANKSPWPGILTCVITVGFFAIIGIIIFNGLPLTTEAGGQAIMLLIGSLVSGLGMVLSFWFGTTRGSETKNEMLANSIPMTSVAAVKPPQP